MRIIIKSLIFKDFSAFLTIPSLCLRVWASKSTFSSWHFWHYRVCVFGFEYKNHKFILNLLFFHIILCKITNFLNVRDFGQDYGWDAGGDYGRDVRQQRRPYRYWYSSTVDRTGTGTGRATPATSTILSSTGTGRATPASSTGRATPANLSTSLTNLSTSWDNRMHSAECRSYNIIATRAPIWSRGRQIDHNLMKLYNLMELWDNE